MFPATLLPSPPPALTDIGHGTLLTLFAAWMVWKEKELSAGPQGEMFVMAFKGRYMLLMMGCFSSALRSHGSSGVVARWRGLLRSSTQCRSQGALKGGGLPSRSDLRSPSVARHRTHTPSSPPPLPAVYCGFIYNDLFAVGTDLFGTKWAYPPSVNGTLVLEALPTGTSSTDIYPFGVDPAWRVAENELLYFNSLKMKMCGGRATAKAASGG